MKNWQQINVNYVQKINKPYENIYTSKHSFAKEMPRDERTGYQDSQSQFLLWALYAKET